MHHPELTAKQHWFVREYLIDLHATNAAIRAGYSPESAYSIGSENLKKPEIQSALEKEMAKRSERTGITQDKVLRELARVAFADMGSFADWGPEGVKLRPSNELSLDDAAAIVELSESKNKHGTSSKIKLHDKVAALDKLMRHLGMYKERTPLDQLLDYLPPDFARELRRAIAAHLAAKARPDDPPED